MLSHLLLRSRQFSSSPGRSRAALPRLPRVGKRKRQVRRLVVLVGDTQTADYESAQAVPCESMGVYRYSSRRSVDG
jgi:hypothetical protein